MKKDNTRADLQVMLLFFIISFCGFAALTFYIIDKTKLNGKIHTEISRGKNLVANILPPAGYIVEAHLFNSKNLNDLRSTDSDYLNTIKKFESDYDLAKKDWDKSSPEILKKLGESDVYVKEYFRLSKTDFVNSLSSDKKKQVYFKLEDLFLKHRAIILSTIKIQQNLNTDIEQDAIKSIKNSINYMILAAIILISIVTVASVYIGKRVTFYNKRLNDLMVEQDNFYMIIANDLRESVWNASTMFSLINEKGLNQSEKESIMKIFEIQYDKIAVLLDNLLELRRLNKQSISPELNMVNVADVIKEGIGPLEETANLQNVKITKNIVDCDVKIDHTIIATVLRNLVSNALKSSYANGEIKISTEVINKMLVLKIKEYTDGIQNEKLQGILNSTKGIANMKGSELGLKIYEELVKRNGGRFFVQKNYGNETEYRIEFDLK